MWRLDHLAVTAPDLDDGVATVEAWLGVTLGPGGKHALMSTHNRLLGLGDIYLEVITPDPAAPPPGRPRWFRLDERRGAARLTNWVAACDDLDAALAAAPPGAGRAVALERGAYRWRMGIPDDGRLPFGECFPALIQWQGAAHPARALPVSGVSLRRLIVTHPEANALRRALAPLRDARVSVVSGPVAIRAEFDTPRGRRWLE
ncbi:MAG: VOC family protein [Paracoccaceae bacterium]|nr:MAG: VOC family protein [Paracoccaceae bacterium]